MKHTVFILTALLLATGCSDDESNQEDNLLFGSWQLTSFVNQSTSSIVLASDFPNPNEITITFNADLQFTGSTVRNNFLGSFSFSEGNRELVLIDFTTTDVNETELGNLFYQNLDSSYNQQTGNWENTYEITQENELKVFYSEEEYMTFDRL